MDEKSCRQPVRVAVVGSGMAGLVSAWLIQHDPRQRYHVKMFETGPVASLDAASLSVLNPGTDRNERIDVPMRAFTEGYYHNLIALYNFLGIRYHVQPFLFSFARIAAEQCKDGPRREEQYFIHASNNHQLPPPRPPRLGLMSYLNEVVFALLCYLWFTISCLLIPVRQHHTDPLGETFQQYLTRIKLSSYFVRWYLLPLMSAVTTCPHDDLLKFPARDVVDYKRCITSGRQLTVSQGIHQVQRKLLKDVDISYAAKVERVAPEGRQVRVRWRQYQPDGESVLMHDMFDKVVLAVPPNVVGEIFEPLQSCMQRIPTTEVTTVIHFDHGHAPTIAQRPSSCHRKDTQSIDRHAAQVIHLATTREARPRTEATHVQSCGALVTSCPVSHIEKSNIIASSTFIRVLRTPQSRALVNQILGASAREGGQSDEKASLSQWVNGDGGVYVAGSWCWDGMVLLEGCVVSALRTAAALGIPPPWTAPGTRSQQFGNDRYDMHSP